MKLTTLFSPLRCLALLLFGTFLSVSAAAAGEPPPIAPGDDKARVLEELGPPNGTMGSQHFKVLYFERGEVYLRDGLVERAEIVSQEEADRRRVAREERREALRLARERERRERIEEGRTIREEKLASETFRGRPARDRLAFWRTFNRHYPEVDVSFEIDVARAEVEEEIRETERAERLKRERLALEERTRRAEIRASLAEEAARKAEEERRRALLRPRIIHSAPTYIIRPDRWDKDKGKWKSGPGKPGGSFGPAKAQEPPQLRVSPGGTAIRIQTGSGAEGSGVGTAGSSGGSSSSTRVRVGF